MAAPYKDQWVPDQHSSGRSARAKPPVFLSPSKHSSGPPRQPHLQRAGDWPRPFQSRLTLRQRRTGRPSKSHGRGDSDDETPWWEVEREKDGRMVLASRARGWSNVWVPQEPQKARRVSWNDEDDEWSSPKRLAPHPAAARSQWPPVNDGSAARRPRSFPPRPPTPLRLDPASSVAAFDGLSLGPPKHRPPRSSLHTTNRSDTASWKANSRTRTARPASPPPSSGRWLGRVDPHKLDSRPGSPRERHPWRDASGSGRSPFEYWAAVPFPFASQSRPDDRFAPGSSRASNNLRCSALAARPDPGQTNVAHSSRPRALHEHPSGPPAPHTLAESRGPDSRATLYGPPLGSASGSFAPSRAGEERAWSRPGDWQQHTRSRSPDPTTFSFRCIPPLPAPAQHAAQRSFDGYSPHSPPSGVSSMSFSATRRSPTYSPVPPDQQIGSRLGSPYRHVPNPPWLSEALYGPSFEEQEWRKAMRGAKRAREDDEDGAELQGRKRSRHGTASDGGTSGGWLDWEAWDRMRMERETKESARKRERERAAHDVRGDRERRGWRGQPH